MWLVMKHWIEPDNKWSEPFALFTRADNALIACKQLDAGLPRNTNWAYEVEFVPVWEPAKHTNEKDTRKAEADAEWGFDTTDWSWNGGTQWS